MSNSNNSKINSNTQDSVKIRRCSLNDQFTVISNESVEESRLSWAAKGLLCYIISRPSNWCVYVSHLSKIYTGNSKGNGRDAIRSMLNELKDCGYLRFIKQKNAKGQWENWYEVYPVPQDFKIIFPEPDQPAPVSPAPVNPAPITSNEANKKLQRTTTTPTPSFVNPQAIQDAKEVVVVSSSEIAKNAMNLADQCKKTADKWGKKWKLTFANFQQLLNFYTMDFILDALNHMANQETQADLDEKSSKQKKTSRIDKPLSYLQMCLKNNYCLSEHARFRVSLKS